MHPKIWTKKFEFIPWILSQCATVEEARKLVEKINILNVPFNDKLPLAQLHWIISDSYVFVSKITRK